MKRSKEKIGIRTEKMREEAVPQKKVQKVIIVLLILSLTACEKAWHGRDGRPGDAYLALTWYESEPTYIDAGTNAIPPVFYWGDYYKIQPGYYSFYYEGSVWAGMSWAYYGWEVDYEINEIPGEGGDWYYHGADGPDNFFTIECSPYGPYISGAYKSMAISEKYELLEENESMIKVKQKADGVSMVVTYRRLPVKSEASVTEIK